MQMVHSWTFWSVWSSSINQESDILKCYFNFFPRRHTWPCQRASETFLEGIQYLLRVCGHPSGEIDYVWWLTVSNTSILLWILQLQLSNGHKLPLSWGHKPFQVELAVYPCGKVMMQHLVEPQAQGWRTHFRGEMWRALAASRSYWASA